MNKAHTVTCFPSPAFGGSRSARWSTSNFNHWVCQNCATGRCPQSNLWFQTSCFQSKCRTNVLLVIQSSPSLLHLLFVLFIITNHPESVVGMDIYNYSHHYNSWNSLFPKPTYHIVRVIGLSFSQRICSKIVWQIRISPISSKNHWITHFFQKNHFVKTNDSQFLIISLFQTLMIFQKSIHQNFINILISQYEKPSKQFFGNPKHHWIAQFFPSKPLSIHHLGLSGFPGPSQKLHLQDHPIRLRQWQLRTLCLKELPELGVWPRSAPHRVIRVFIIIYIYIFIYLLIYLFISIFICNYIYMYVCIYIYIYIN